MDNKHKTHALEIISKPAAMPQKGQQKSIVQLNTKNTWRDKFLPVFLSARPGLCPEIKRVLRIFCMQCMYMYKAHVGI